MWRLEAGDWRLEVWRSGSGLKVNKADNYCTLLYPTVLYCTLLYIWESFAKARHGLDRTARANWQNYSVQATAYSLHVMP